MQAVSFSLTHSNTLSNTHTHTHTHTQSLPLSHSLTLFAPPGESLFCRLRAKRVQEFNKQAGQEMTRERARRPEALPGYNPTLVTGRGAKVCIGVQDSSTAWNQKPMPPLVCPKAHMELLRWPLPAVRSSNMVRCQDHGLPRANSLVGWSRSLLSDCSVANTSLPSLPWTGSDCTVNKIGRRRKTVFLVIKLGGWAGRKERRR
jgi:hypothetical protein